MFGKKQLAPLRRLRPGRTKDMGAKKGSKVKRKTAGRNTKTHACKTIRRAHERSSTHADVRYEAFHAAAMVAAGGEVRRGATSLALIDDANQTAIDEDAGAYVAVATGRRFATEAGLASHMKTKDYKRAVKRLMRDGKPHDDRDAERAAGMGAPKND